MSQYGKIYFFWKLHLLFGVDTIYTNDEAKYLNNYSNFIEYFCVNLQNIHMRADQSPSRCRGNPFIYVMLQYFRGCTDNFFCQLVLFICTLFIHFRFSM